MESVRSSTYQTHPVHVFPWLTIEHGYPALADLLAQEVRASPHRKTIIIDGFSGVCWPSLVARLQTACETFPQKISWFSTESCFRSAEEIETYLATFLTEDPVFGRRFSGVLEELWLPEAVTRLQEEIATQVEGITILTGFGASLVIPGGIHVYVDMPKDRCQQLAASRDITNVGAREPASFSAMYKRFYFIDWPMLNRIKRAEMPLVDYVIDGTNEEEPKIVKGNAFRRSLHELSQQPFRVKPWFAPGPWGGQWMKEHFGLPADQPNYAWSFEVIAPENGVLLGNGEQSMECSFDYLLWAETDAVLGTSVAARYGSTFPIRFDYLDTMEGTNLSCQVHPRLDYIRERFGEPFTQDETYYIVTNTPGASVFLGLREDADLEHFQEDARQARDQSQPFEMTHYVQSWPSHPHDLFLIPSGTVHCSGANNLVLEISATPYIYTFKIYDYLRTDLQGNLRHVHLDHAFANLDESRRTNWVGEHLLPQPHLLRSGTDWAEYRLGNIPQLFFAIHRLEFTQTIEDHTEEKFVMLNLVEGTQCWIETAGHAPVVLHFAESVIIPASVGAYRLVNAGTNLCRVIKAFVKG